MRNWWGRCGIGTIGSNHCGGVDTMAVEGRELQKPRKEQRDLAIAELENNKRTHTKP
jgi:hypothetical protein